VIIKKLKKKKKGKDFFWRKK